MKKKTKRKRPRMWVNVAHSFKEAEEFDTKFWRMAGIEARFSAAWQMLGEYYKIRGIRGFKQRLQRAVRNIEHL